MSDGVTAHIRVPCFDKCYISTSRYSPRGELLLHLSIVIEHGTESGNWRRESDRTGGPAQPGLKATLQALAAEVLYPTDRPRGDQGDFGAAAPASGRTLLSRHSC